ncbi:unnamed protein product [Spirodela intermedia]|uniref:Uncharacterized protein n=1 Tax=Spirodela intermedia TaxID=51605 RepID=A0A7I8JRS5_SPIIN|nr:unnamed protein product [Spirodela intermedia]CAA6672122.1 unnamed protein product [Spirodela intermedia]
MARGACSGRELAERWRGILEAEAEDDDEGGGGGGVLALSSARRGVHQSKEEWFVDTFSFLINLPKETHIWCGCWELMGPLLETFHNFFKDKFNDSPLTLLWKRISQELGQCTQCISQHHQAQEAYATEYEFDTVGPLLKTLQCLDEERVVEHLKDINTKILRREYDPEYYGSEVVSIMFEFQTFIEAIDNSHDVALSGHQQYPGVYALLFLKSSKARAIGLRLAKSMGKMRLAADLEPLQPLLRKYIGFLETEVLSSGSESSRPRVEHERLAVWLGIKTLLGFLEAPAFEEGILERYPVFLSIVLNHVSDDTPEFSYAVTCLKLLFEMLGCKLWLRTTLSPSVMRNTLLGQSFHTRNEKSHKEIFDLFLPFLQSLEALQDGEHEKQRRHLLYFLLHQVTQSSNFSLLMRKNACKIALLIVHRGYKMNPPCPPSECAHMWGPSLAGSLKDSSLHSSLRQPAFDLMQTIIVSDAAALASLILKYSASSNDDVASNTNFSYAENEVSFSLDEEENESSCWNEFSTQGMLTSQDCKDWSCVPMLWLDVLVEVDPYILPISFCKAVVWALSRFSLLDPDTNVENRLPVREWMTAYTKEVLSSLGWEIPRGSDDGGEGRESKNSVKASSMCIPLMRAFKRCGTHFLIQVEQRDLHKQFTWEPKMAESLILSLIDPNDAVRQADRIILENVSKTQGLTSGLQFLCSGVSSLSAMLSGLKYALKQVQWNSSLLGFHDLHHLFFIIFKLLKEVVSSQKTAISSREDANRSKLVSGGGFLQQPCFDYSPVKTQDLSLNTVDLQSWKTFSCLLSAITWPCILKYLVKGREFIDKKFMTCVRFLETIPVIFERMSLSSGQISQNLETISSLIFDFKWLPDLADWGKSSLVVVIRHWKKSILSLLNLIKGSCHISMACTFGAIETLVNSDNIAMDELKGRLSELSVLLSKLAVRTVEEASSKLESVPSEHPSLGRKSPIADTPYPNIKDLYIDKVHVSTGKDRVIVLSDDEREKLISPDMEALSSSRLSDRKLDNKLSVCEDGPKVSDNMESAWVNGTSKPRQSLSYPKVSGYSKLIPQKHDIDVVDKSQPFPGILPFVDKNAVSERSARKHVKDRTKNSLSSKKVDSVLIGSSTHSFPREKSCLVSGGNNAGELERRVDAPEDATPATRGRGVPESVSGNHEEDTVHNAFSDKVGSLLGSSTHSFSHKNSDRVSTGNDNVERERRVDVPKDAIFDSDDDTLESASDPIRHLAQLTKPIMSVPKRKVIQLEMPTNNKNGLLKRLDNGMRRLKPPKLDDWYRPILEIDYFSIVGLSPDGVDASASVAKLQEVPLSFVSPDHYIQIFRPLVLEEFKAQLLNSFLETSSSDEMFCGNLCIVSVERVDDFHIVRARPEDGESARAFSENDLVLLTKEPLQNTAQHVHVVGKLERREKNDKTRATILVIRFYLQSNSSRLIKVGRLLVERTKWYISRIMSITPQLREFQALSSLNYIPMLPAILRPTDCHGSFDESVKVELGSLSLSMQKMLKLSFNDSQLQAISVAIQGCEKSFGLSLIQGPPGTGKTRTIVAITSALLCLGSSKRFGASKELNKTSRQDTTVRSDRSRISQSAAIARAWQDAAYAKQLITEEEEHHSGSVQKSAGGRVLICAQSNAAVDELISRMKGGLYGEDGKMYRPYIVRVGNVKTVHPNSLPFFIDTLVEQRLAQDKSCSDAKNDLNVESSASLQVRLEKLVESIRLYESKRASIQDPDMSKSNISEDGSSKENNVGELNYANIESKLKTLYGQKKILCMDINAAQARERKLSEEIKFVKQKTRRSILREAQIVVTTLSGCGGDLYGACFDSSSRSRLGNLPEYALFDAVIIDEAAQALEPATLIPLQLLKSNGTKCVMVGDPKQLPATVLSCVASKFLYECSMFERMQRAGHPVVMLTEQYRMHPEICRFPSTHFYGDKLSNGLQMASKSAPFHETGILGPYMFFDVTDGRENQGRGNSSLSLYNESEADMAVKIVKFLKKRYPSEFSAGRIGVITPYKSQLSLLRSRFSGALGPSVTADVEFNTVDGFQGREVDILILSTVRASVSNAREQGSKSNSIGFVADVRRMNVALTRAKHSLWIVGNARTLQTNLHWCALVNDARERNLFISVARPYRSAFKSAPGFAKEDVNSPQLERARVNARKPTPELQGIPRKSSEGKQSLQRKNQKERRTALCGTKSQINWGNSREDLISKRKRQREAVDALLSSALISSKKPESLPRPAPKRRP